MFAWQTRRWPALSQRVVLPVVYAVLLALAEPAGARAAKKPKDRKRGEVARGGAAHGADGDGDDGDAAESGQLPAGFERGRESYGLPVEERAGGRTADYVMPSFDPNMDSVVEVQVGDPIYMHCRVFHASNYVVAWLKDSVEGVPQVLTIDQDVFSQDARFQISPRPGEPASDWILMIRFASLSDAGRYQCQLNTEPSKIFTVNLVVKVSTTPPPSTTPSANATEQSPSLIKASSARVLTGSDLELSCEVRVLTDTGVTYDHEVIWLLNDTEIRAKDKRNKYASVQERRGDKVVHKLRVLRATSADAGRYTCKPDNSPASSMLVQVNGGTATAMLRSAGKAQLLATFMFIVLLRIALADDYCALPFG